jgi:protein-L-isoaspartate(D-aspartate) O-methyltransferase
MRWPRLARRHRYPATDPERQRALMVADQLEARGIRDAELLRAFRAVERHRFVDERDAYGDRALPLGSGQTISQPYVVARMTELARPPEGWRDAAVLEIGTGSGYQAAILAELGARVTTIERHESLATGARQHLDAAGYPDVMVLVGDGTQGAPSRGPYRSILVTAGAPSVPQPLLDQLDPESGRLVMPVGSREHQLLTRVVREGNTWSAAELDPVVFVPLIGQHGLEG